MQKKCEKCEVMFEAIRSDSRYCSKPCYYAVYAEQNVERRRAARARYYEKNKEAQDARVKAWHASNPERVKEIKRAHYERNREKMIAGATQFAKENPELMRGYKAKYAKTDAGKLAGKAAIHRRRARIKANGGSFSREEWLALVERCGNRCVACATPGTATTLEADHIVPIKLGGSNEISNIQPLCRSCNARKSAKVKDYIAAPPCAPETENGT